MPSMVIRACFIGGNHAGTPQTIHANIEGEFFCQWIFAAFVNQIELFQIGIRKPSVRIENHFCFAVLRQQAVIRVCCRTGQQHIDGVVASLLQMGLRKRIQPLCQSVVGVVLAQAGASASALLLRHRVTQVLRLTASLRAFRTLLMNSLPRLVSLLRTMKSRTAGAAKLPRMAARASVIRSSVSVKPRATVRRRLFGSCSRSRCMLGWAAPARGD